MRLLLLAVLIASCAPATPPAAPTPVPQPSAAPLSDVATAAEILATSADLDELRADAQADQLSAPAARSWTNVLLLQDTPGERFLASMYGMKRGLDRNCNFCHEKDEFAKDTKHKKVARTMLLLTERINRETFAATPEVTCWTCHRGTPEPEKAPSDFAARISRATPKEFVVPAADAEKPAREVFKNVQLLGHLPAGKMPAVMGAFSAALGVDCAFCHVKDDFASDDKAEKKFTREMMLVTSRASAQVDGASGAVTCWTCHRGSAHPESLPGERP